MGDDFYSFLYAVGTALVVAARHDGTTPEIVDNLKNTLVVGSHIDVGYHLLRLLIDALYDGLASQHGQRLAGEARRGVACRYNSNKLHNKY